MRTIVRRRPSALKYCKSKDHEGPNPLPRAEFTKDRNNPDGLNIYCRACTNRKSRRWKQRHPLHSIWNDMLARCENPAHKSYDNYGGRGIKVCDRWFDFDVFKADIEAEIGPRPDGKTPSGMSLYTLNRVNNDGNYERGNVEWATYEEQGQNTRRTVVDADTVREVRRLWESTRSLWGQDPAKWTARKLAERFGLNQRTVRSIVSREQWKNVGQGRELAR